MEEAANEEHRRRTRRSHKPFLLNVGFCGEKARRVSLAARPTAAACATLQGCVEQCGALCPLCPSEAASTASATCDGAKAASALLADTPEASVKSMRCAKFEGAPPRSSFPSSLIPPHSSTHIMSAARSAFALQRVARLRTVTQQVASGSRTLATKADALPLGSEKVAGSVFAPLDTFGPRHIGPRDDEVAKMLSELGYETMDAFIADAVPKEIRLNAQGQKETQTGVGADEQTDKKAFPAISESELARRGKEIGAMNQKVKSLIGMGYHNTNVPGVILRNVSGAAGVMGCERGGAVYAMLRLLLRM